MGVWWPLGPADHMGPQGLWSRNSGHWLLFGPAEDVVGLFPWGMGGNGALEAQGHGLSSPINHLATSQSPMRGSLKCFSSNSISHPQHLTWDQTHNLGTTLWSAELSGQGLVIYFFNLRENGGVIACVLGIISNYCRFKGTPGISTMVMKNKLRATYLGNNELHKLGYAISPSPCFGVPWYLLNIPLFSITAIFCLLFWPSLWRCNFKTAKFAYFGHISMNFEKNHIVI